MSKIENFLTAEEEREIVEAIRRSERKTSGEIRVHIENTSKKDIFNRAIDVFHLLKMDNTKLRNGVLIYVAIDDRQFVIYGDEGINKLVPENFWNDTKNSIQKHFKNKAFKLGLISGIEKAGNELEKYFPWDYTDTNELSDDISKGNN